MEKRKLVVGGVALVAALGLGRYGLASSANEKARERVDSACRRIEAGLTRRLDAQPTLLVRLFAEDTPRVRELIGGSMRPTCEGLRQELTGSRWNYGRTYASPARDNAELDAILERARPRCRAVLRAMKTALVGVGQAMAGDEAPVDDAELPPEVVKELDATCDSFAARPSVEGGRALGLLDEWPQTLERFADMLERAPTGAASAPAPTP